MARGPVDPNSPALPEASSRFSPSYYSNGSDLMRQYDLEDYLAQDPGHQYKVTGYENGLGSPWTGPGVIHHLRDGALLGDLPEFI